MSNSHLPAYPSENNKVYFHGLTKREYFTCEAMRSMLSTLSFNENIVMGNTDLRNISMMAVNMADLVLAELSRTDKVEE